MSLAEMLIAVFSRRKPTTRRHFVVEYSLPYEHGVQVGIEASGQDNAIAYEPALRAVGQGETVTREEVR